MSCQTKTLVIGGGSIGERHVRCFQNTNRTDVWLCENNAEIRDSLQTRYQLSQTFHDLETAITHQPDIAVICTPTHLHIPMAIELAEAQIHLLIEKPVSTNLDGIEYLAQLRDQHALVLGVGYTYRSHPVLSRMRDAIHENRFGKPLQINVVAGQHFPYYRPAYREIYYTNRAAGGGAIQDSLTHMINAGEWLVGSITKLTADADHLLLPGVDVEDSVNVLTRHGEIMGAYTLNQHQAANEISITVICERGTVRFEGHHSRWNWITEPETEWQNETQPELERDTLFINQANTFLDNVEGKGSVLCSLEEGTQTLYNNLAILESVTDQKWVTIEPSRAICESLVN